MYMRPRCTGMLRHPLLLTFAELTDSKYSMIFSLHSHLLLDVRLAFGIMLLFSIWSNVPCHGPYHSDKFCALC